MTHTSTEQPEALRLANALRDGEYSLYQERNATEAELRRLHARVQELKEMLRKEVQHSSGLASQARVPLSDAQIEAEFKAAGGRWADNSYWVIEDADLHPFVRGITQEKQG